MSASLAILGEQGPSGLTVKAVVQRARSSVGSFYARFEGKDDLLDYLGERVWTDATRRWQEALQSREWDELDLAGVAAVSADLLHEAARSRSSYLRALDRAGSGGDREEAYASFLAHVHEGLAELMLARSAEIVRPDPARAVRVALAAATGVIDGALAAPDPTAEPDTPTADARDVMLAYLAGDAGGASSGEVEFFEVWG